jgi:aldehyde:ferredoxin oxidoreductase
MNSVIQSFGCFCLINEWEEIAKCAETAARLGLDFMSSGSLISFAMELYQRGLLNKGQADGLEIKWGDAKVVRILLRKIAFREGIGDVLAQGLANTSAELGSDVEKYAMQVKGLGILYDPRSKIDSTEIFSQLSNIRGYVSNVSIAMVPRTPEQIRRYCQKIGLSNEVIARIVDEKAYNVARLNKWTEDFTSLLEFLGICQFPLYQRISLSTWAELYSAITGIETSYKDLIKKSENVWDLKRAFNIREGASRADDNFPERIYSDSVPVGSETFPPLDRDEISQLLSDYYEERGWDRISGKPSKERLFSLGIEE